MIDYKLNTIDPDDIDDVLEKIEESFAIKFVDTDFVGLSTFGELCDCIIRKTDLDHTDSCTSQQAFYKLRHAIRITTGIQAIKPNTLLVDILPRKSRLAVVREIQNKVGFKLNLLRPKKIVLSTLAILLFASFAGFAFDWKVGIIGFVLSITGFYVAIRFGKETDLRTVGELVRKMTRENYIRSRRNAATVNKNEMAAIIVDLFSKELDLDKSKLTVDALLT